MAAAAKRARTSKAKKTTAKRTTASPAAKKARATKSPRRRAPSKKLETYYKKRDFEKTPEPKGKPAAQVKPGFGYIIQKHAASRLHYDFRLELDGVLLSWAVPKGPSLNPGERRLAVRTEDHPLEYADFEGVIPEGEYGGGTVMLWDRGSWTPEGDAQAQLEKGHLVFQLEGERLRGRWHLVRTRGEGTRDKSQWLLFKGRDDEALKDGAAETVDAETTSVVTGRSMTEIAAQRDRTWRSNRKPTGESARAKYARYARAAKADRPTAVDADAIATPKLSELVAQIPTTVSFTNLDKVLFKDAGFTKAALIAYYAVIEPYLMPHLANRLVTLVRCPDGAPGGEAVRQRGSKHCFYQKHAKEGVAEEIRRVPIKEDDGSKAEYMAITDRDGLLAAIQLGSLELHMWGSHIDEPERPDHMVLDLDPGEGVPWKAVVEAAFALRTILSELGLESWVKTTGGKGLHVCVPTSRRMDWDEFKDVSRAIVTVLDASDPSRYTTNMAKNRRHGRIFLDYLRNGRGATAIAPYSTRARPGAPVATPITWKELEKGIDPASFTLATVPSRMEGLKEDPWEGFLDCRQTITAAMKKRLGL